MFLKCFKKKLFKYIITIKKNRKIKKLKLFLNLYLLIFCLSFLVYCNRNIYIISKNNLYNLIKIYSVEL